MDIIGYLVIGGIIGIGAAAVSSSATRDKKNAIYSRLSSISDFTATKKVLGVDGQSGIAVDLERKKIALLTSPTPSNEQPATFKEAIEAIKVGIEQSKISADKVSVRIFDYKELLSVEVHEDGGVVTRTSRTSQLGTALLGGIAFGGIGALVGGLTGKTVSSEKVKKLELRIIVNDANRPLHDVCFQNVKGKKGGLINSQAAQLAREWHGILEVLIRQADADSPHSTSQQAINSVAEEIQKLAALYESGFLTEEEFKSQKEKVLSNA